MTEHGWSAPQVCRLTGVTYRQLDYWARTYLVRPSTADARGSGTQRRYSDDDVLFVWAVAGLLSSGVSLGTVRDHRQALVEALAKGDDELRLNVGMGAYVDLVVRLGHLRARAQEAMAERRSYDADRFDRRIVERRSA